MSLYGSTNLKNVTIPDSVTTIEQWAFNSSSLTSVNIGNGVSTIGVFVFFACTSLTAITVDPLNSSYASVDGVLFDKSQSTLIQYPVGKTGTTYAIPTSVTSIIDEAFYYCTNLTSVTVGSSLTNIGFGTFDNCTSLTAITVDPLNSFYSSVDGVLFDRSQSTLVRYPEAKAGSYTVLNSVTKLGHGAFYNCTSLTNIVLGNIISLGDWAFGDCSSLTNISIPNSVTDIGFGTFFHCASLTAVTVGSSVSSIGVEAFMNCTSLTGVYFKGNAPVIGSDVFNNTTNTTVYYLPGTTGWDTTFAERPTAQWFLPYPVILNLSPSFGIQTNAFGFRISWATKVPVVVEASTSPWAAQLGHRLAPTP